MAYINDKAAAKMDFDLNDCDMVDFLDVQPLKPKKKKRKYKKNYDSFTTENCRTMRAQKIDPISDEVVNEDYAYEVKKMWDPITGEFLDEDDPFGSLYFDSVGLVKWFYINKLNYLWKDEVDEGENGGYYEGIPGEGIGAGEDFFLRGRGTHHPENFIWRLPINCYLEKGLSRSVPFKGPKLSRDQIVIIHNLCKSSPKSHWSITFSEIPDIVKIYDLYMEAINKNPDITGIDYSDDEDPKFKANMRAIQKLRSM